MEGQRAHSGNSSESARVCATAAATLIPKFLKSGPRVLTGQTSCAISCSRPQHGSPFKLNARCKLTRPTRRAPHPHPSSGGASLGHLKKAGVAKKRNPRRPTRSGGFQRRDREPVPSHARHLHGPVGFGLIVSHEHWWALRDLNPRPADQKPWSAALPV
jgi:hypothetical protein